MNNVLTLLLLCQTFGFKKTQAFLEDQLAQLKFRHNLFEPTILFLQRPHLAELRPPHAAEFLSLAVIGFVRNSCIAAIANNIHATMYMNFNLS
jgi:hypothetical protein